LLGKTGFPHLENERLNDRVSGKRRLAIDVFKARRREMTRGPHIPGKMLSAEGKVRCLGWAWEDVGRRGRLTGKEEPVLLFVWDWLALGLGEKGGDVSYYRQDQRRKTMVLRCSPSDWQRGKVGKRVRGDQMYLGAV